MKKLITLYEFGPSFIVPSNPNTYIRVDSNGTNHVYLNRFNNNHITNSPIVFFKNGLTTATLVDPVTPKTQNNTAASTLDSLQWGLVWLVHVQNLRINLLLEFITHFNIYMLFTKCLSLIYSIFEGNIV